MGALLSLRLLWGGVALVGWPFPGCGEGGLVGCVQSRKLGARASPSEDYPADKLRRHFTCGFDFKHSL